MQAKAGESNTLLFETFSLSLFFTHAIPREARAPKKSVIQAFYNFSLVESNAKISLKRSVLKSKAISDLSFQLN